MSGHADTQRTNAVALAALLLATFMGFLDLFIVNVAAPSIQRDLPATFEQVQLVLPPTSWPTRSGSSPVDVWATPTAGDGCG